MSIVRLPCHLALEVMQFKALMKSQAAQPEHFCDLGSRKSQSCAGGRTIFASGSPCKDVEFEGRTISSSQGEAPAFIT